MGRVKISLVVLAVAALVATGCGATGGGGGTRLSLVAYSTPREAFAALIPAFQKTAAGKGVSFSQSYGASGDQSRAVAAGLPSDVVELSLTPDMTKLADAGLVARDWNRDRYKGMVTDSVVAIAVRKGNPKNIHTWADLVKPGVEVITPNPFSSGGARWNVMGAYGAQIEQGRSPAEAKAYLLQLFKNVPVQDKSAREALQTFVGGKGDAMIAYENEAIAARQAGGAGPAARRRGPAARDRHDLPQPGRADPAGRGGVAVRQRWGRVVLALGDRSGGAGRAAAHLPGGAAGHGGQPGRRHGHRLGAGPRRVPGPLGRQRPDRPALRPAHHRRRRDPAGVVRAEQPARPEPGLHPRRSVPGDGVRDPAVRGPRRAAGAAHHGARYGGGGALPRRQPAGHLPPGATAGAGAGDAGRGRAGVRARGRRVRRGDPDLGEPALPHRSRRRARLQPGAERRLRRRRGGLGGAAGDGAGGAGHHRPRAAQEDPPCWLERRGGPAPGRRSWRCGARSSPIWRWSWCCRSAPWCGAPSPPGPRRSGTPSPPPTRCTRCT